MAFAHPARLGLCYCPSPHRSRSNLRALARQQNSDGGLPNRIALVPIDNWNDPGTPSASVVSGRSLSGLPVVANLTNDRQVRDVIRGLEGFLRHQVEGELWFTGQHPDLHGGDFEPNSVWGAAEYWLNKGDLERATADANLGFLMLCPVQLSWVDNPTQLAFSEQQDYSQYCPYTYESKKVSVLARLGEATGDPMWTRMAVRFAQMNFFVMDNRTGSDTKGAFREAIADPWLARGGSFDYTGSLYMDSLSVDLFLQLLETGGL